MRREVHSDAFPVVIGRAVRVERERQVKMARIAAIAVVALLIVPIIGQGEPAPTPDTTAHGGFTGQIKPVIYVTDVEASAPFYRDALGFGFHGYANHEGTPYYAELDAGGVKFGLHEAMSDGQKAKIGQTRLYFRVRDLAAHRNRVLAWGGKPGEIITTDWMDMFIVRDGDGNEIVFAVTDPARHSIDPWTIDPGSVLEDPEAH